MYRRRVTLEDATADPAPPTRRSLRAAATGEVSAAPASSAPAAATTPASPAASSTVPAIPAASVSTTAQAVAAEVPQASTSPALAWLDPQAVLTRTYAVLGMDLATSVPAVPDLLAGMRRRRGLGAVIAPLALMLLLVAGYSVTTLAWPLGAVPPQIAAGQVQPTAAPAATLTWPQAGSAAVGVGGIDAPVSSTGDNASIASITKVVTALLVLDELPLAAGEQGREFAFTSRDRATYRSYLANGESALDVPAGGTLTEYQLLEGMLIGSANNYADRLAAELWPTDAVFAAAAEEWLSSHGLDGITVVNPSGYDSANQASPAALVPLAEKALSNPVIAEIVAKPSVDLPGAGTVQNTNALLADPGVVGVKTGTLQTYSVLSAKDVTIGDTTVRLYASVLGQGDSEARFAASRDLYAQLEQELQPFPSITAGTLAGEVTTAWGEKVDVVTTTDASVVLWNGAVPAATISLDLGGKAEKGDVVGTLELTGPLNTKTVELKLADDVDGPSPWWRLTHPVELFGLGR